MRYYVIVDVDDLTSDKIEAAVESDAANLRYCNSNAKCVLKFDTIYGARPKAFEGMTIYTVDEIKVEMAKAAWISDDS